jgi:hypothetical protein
VAGAVAACVVLAPGVAAAEDDPSSPAPPEPVTDLLEDAQGSAPEGAEQQAGEQQTADETPEPPPFELPQEIEDGLHQFAEQAGISEECVDGVTESLELIGNGIAGLPGELQQLGEGLADAVQESIETQSPTPVEEFLSGLAPSPPEEGSEEPPLPIGGDIAAGLQQLADTLQSEACQPAPPAEHPEPEEEQTQEPAPAAHQTPQSPAPPAPQQPVQPVAYPGYAPTGAEPDDGPSPEAVGVGLALLAGSGAWAGRRWRAAHR